MVSEEKLRIDLPRINGEAKEDIAALVRRSEEYYFAQIQKVASDFEAQFPENPLILLAGPSSSGKTTTSYRLQDALHRDGIKTLTVSLDDFYKNREMAKRMPDGSYDLDDPEMVNIGEMEQCLKKLEQLGAWDFPIYDFGTGRRKEGEARHLVFDDHTAIIIEGLHALNPIVCDRPFFQKAMKIYISIKSEYYIGEKKILNTRQLRLIRRLIRDANYRNSNLQQTLAIWNNVVSGEERFIRPFRTRADHWIDSIHFYEPLVYGPVLNALFEKELPRGDAGQMVEFLLEKLSYFTDIDQKVVPKDSLLQEFLILT